MSIIGSNPRPDSGQPVYGSRAVGKHQQKDTEHAGVFGLLKQVDQGLSRNDQLFVPSVNEKLIASGVYESDFKSLCQVDLLQKGSLPSGDVKTARKILEAAGLHPAIVKNMQSEPAVRLARLLSVDSPLARSLLPILSRQEASPKLTEKLWQMAADELAGNRPSGTTAFVLGCVEKDTRLRDLRGFHRPDELPGSFQSTTGKEFTPKTHVIFKSGEKGRREYDELKQVVQSHINKNGTFTEVQFDDKRLRVDFGYGFEELDALDKSYGGLPGVWLSVRLSGNVDQGLPTTLHESLNMSDQKFDTFANPGYLDARQQVRLDAIASMPRLFNKASFDFHDGIFKPEFVNQVQSYADKHSNTDLVCDLLIKQDFRGIALSEDHNEVEGKQFLSARMNDLFKAGVRVIGIEHVSVMGLQEQIDDYLNEDFQGEMPARLKATLRGLTDIECTDRNCLVDVIQAAKYCPPMQVVAINAENLSEPESDAEFKLAMRDGMMNAVGKDNLDARLKSAESEYTPHPKFALIAGRAHNHSHPGLFDSGVPGFGQLYNVPVLHIEPKSQPVDEKFPVTVESDSIVNRDRQAFCFGLQESDKKALDKRMFNGSRTEREQIKELLGLGEFSRSQVSEARRLSMGTVLASGLALGAPIDQLQRLKTIMEQAPDHRLAEAGEVLGRQGVPFGAAISRLLAPEANDAQPAFAAIRPLLTLGPADLSKANANVFADRNIALRRDAVGNLQLANVHVAFAEFRVPPTNQNLSAAQLEQVKQTFVNLADKKYSSMTVVLDLMQSSRNRRALNNDLTVAESFVGFNANGRASMAHYNRADCIGVAEELVSKLAEHGITAYLAGANNPKLTVQQATWPFQGDHYQSQIVPHQTGYVTHVEVLVPYTDELGNSKVLGFSPGGGNRVREDDPNQPQYISTNDLTPGGMLAGIRSRLNSPHIDLRVHPDGGSLDGAEIQMAQLAFRTKLNLFNNPPTENENKYERDCFCVDLLGGRLTLSSVLGGKMLREAASSATTIDEKYGEICFDYRDALANPNDPVTIEFADGKVATTTKLRSLALFIKHVEIVSGQAPDFSKNVGALLQDERAYCDTFLSPDINGLSKFSRPRAEANARGEQLKVEAQARKQEPEKDEKHARFVQIMSMASVSVGEGQYDEAVTHYKNAAKL